MHRSLHLAGAALAALGITAAVLTASGTSGADDRVPPARMTESEGRAITEQAARRAGPDQRAAFADGTVTAEEYEAAAGRTLACLVDVLRQQAPAGVAVETTGPTWSDDGFRLSYTYGFRRTSPDAPAPPDPTTVERRCQDRFLIQVERAYLAGFQSSPRLDRVAADLRRCATDAGIELPDGDARQAVASYVEHSDRSTMPEALGRCLAARPALLDDVRTG